MAFAAPAGWEAPPRRLNPARTGRRPRLAAAAGAATRSDGGRVAPPTMVTSLSVAASTVAAPPDVLRVLLADNLSTEGMEHLVAAGVEVVVTPAAGLSGDALAAALGTVDALIVRSSTAVTAEVLAAGAPRLQVVGRAGVGVDNVCLAAATAAGVLVVNAPVANADAAAEHTVALLTGLARHVAAADASVKAGRWDRAAFVGVSLVGKTLGVVGYGRIGRAVAARGRALGMNVLASGPRLHAAAAAADGVTAVTIDEAVAAADFLSVHVPLTPSTHHLIDERRLALAKPGARLINASRGGVVDEVAVLKALDAGRLAGAALDVFAAEPPSADAGLCPSAALARHPRVVATPHLGAATAEARAAAGVEVAAAVTAALSGTPVAASVNAPGLAPRRAAAAAPRLALAATLGGVARRLRASAAAADDDAKEAAADAAEADLLRAAVIRGVLDGECAGSRRINAVNADAVARSAGVRVTQVASEAAATAAGTVTVAVDGAPRVAGRLVEGVPTLTHLGAWAPAIPLTGTVLLTAAVDEPGQLGAVATHLGHAGVGVRSWTVTPPPPTATLSAAGRVEEVALVAVALDGPAPAAEVVAAVGRLIGHPALPPIVLEC
ncbi:hypothetical protein MMPV_002591 [Pyropia vietnamensis]